jgi:hypothetical protein
MGEMMTELIKKTELKKIGDYTITSERLEKCPLKLEFEMTVFGMLWLVMITFGFAFAAINTGNSIYIPYSFGSLIVGGACLIAIPEHFKKCGVAID